MSLTVIVSSSALAPLSTLIHVPRCVGGSDGLVSSSEQASQLVFCSAVFKETLRLCPAATVVFLHSTVG